MPLGVVGGTVTIPVAGLSVGTGAPGVCGVGFVTLVIVTVPPTPTVADWVPPFTVAPSNILRVVVVVPLCVIVVLGTYGLSCGTVTVATPGTQVLTALHRL